MINGYARNDGVSFGNDKYSVHFSMEKNSSYKVNISKNLSEKVKTIGVFKRFLHKTPFIRGVMVQMEQSKGYTLMFLVLFIWDILKMFNLEEDLEKSDIFNLITICIVVVMSLYSVIFIFRKILINLKSTLQFHGAEHKVINTYLEGLELNFQNVKKASRISRWCGTELMVFFFILFVLTFFLKYDSIRFLIAFSIAFEIFNLKDEDKIPVLRVLFKLGYFCQEKIFTKEPLNEQLEASIESFKMLLEAEKEDIK